MFGFKTVKSSSKTAATLSHLLERIVTKERIYYIFIEKNHKSILHTSGKALTINQIGNHSK